MFLSKIDLDARTPSVRQMLNDREDAHRNVQKIFSTDRKTAGTLYRIRKTGNKLSLYLLSETEPLVGSKKLNEGMTVVNSKDLTDFYTLAKPGMQFKFDLLAFPCKKKSSPNKKNSARIALRTSDKKIDWLRQKGFQNGFELITVQLINGDVINSDIKNINICSTHFSGILKVTNKEKFINALKTGIGPEKAYGLGLLFIS